MSTPAKPLSENDIRPQHLDFEKEAAQARDIARLLRHKASFEVVPCPACGSDKRIGKWEKFELHYQECRTCATVYVSPRPTPTAIEEYYAKSELYAYWNKYIFPQSENARRERIVRPRVQRMLECCERFGIVTDLLLEVGAGFGTFCEEVQRTKRFQRVVAIEPQPELAASIRARGVEVLERPIEHVDISTMRASVLACFEVIEHLHTPRAFLEACARAVVPGGLLVLSCPNGKGFEVEVLGSIADTVDTEHLNYFNPRSLSLLAERCGFDVLETATPGVLDADIVRNKVLGQKFDLAGQRFLQIVLLERWNELGAAFQDFLKANALSSHMWLVARRRAS